MTGQAEEVLPSFQRGHFVGDLHEDMQIHLEKEHLSIRGDSQANVCPSGSMYDVFKEQPGGHSGLGKVSSP